MQETFIGKMSLLHAILIILPALAFGQVSLKPYNLTATAMFLSIDRDLSGDIDRNEVDASFRQYDADHNGRISHTEFNNYIDQHFPSFYSLHDALFANL
ncbi:hypothetical protein Btru_076203 [Bulinus truncatus]|nr:hypothetical protein Btru_076203 [Bulinus truncatus]